MTITSSQSVAWDAVTGASGYDVELLNAAGGSILGSFNVDAPGTSISATTLFSGRAFGTYNVRVRAKESAGPGNWSGLLELNFSPLGAPQNLRVV